MAEPHPKSTWEQLKEGVRHGGSELKADAVSLEHAAERKVGLHQGQAPAPGTHSFADGLSKIAHSRDELGASIPKLDTKLDHDLADAKALRQEGASWAKDTFNRHVGKSLDTLATSQDPVECAKAFKSIAEEAKNFTPQGLTKTAVTEIATHELGKLEQKYPGLEKAVKDLEAAHAGHEKVEALKGDLKSVRADLKEIHKDLKEHDYGAASLAAGKLAMDTHKLQKDVHETREFLAKEAKEHAAHPVAHAQPHHGGQGLHGAHAPSGILAGPITNNAVPIDGTVLANVTPNAPASVAHGHQGYDVQSHAQQHGQIQAQQQQPHLAGHGGR